MKMCFHGNQDPSSIKHPFISLYSKYQSFIFNYFPDMNSPVFPSLDDIYCISFLNFNHKSITRVSKGPIPKFKQRIDNDLIPETYFKYKN